MELAMPESALFGFGTDQPQSSHYDDENHGQPESIFRDVPALR
jgi:hypothetical protein